ncbi:LLM class flavin-dependent oxidoreductase [Actinomadura sp. ATCC 31491]|uniref:LLM class flavin-dependent oxidoreductase n=1 Tax=Actinomadura luzonensis TaxID=2805427 RepID=A0ABT0G0C7_9ACTN|nr:LLM class flavin-dependent oxidoreductase [Actinomadura luzonensis]MCK2217848.1 LLM class flavin-dependent oxidoreductase [Actinomadura luzonensis]
MTDHPFRFGAVAGRAPDWCGLARRAEALGYATLLVPDTLGTFSPFSAAAAAAAATTRLRVGTYVLSVANRTPRAVAWETATLDALSGGRFELGLGAGRPDAEHDATELGLPFGTPGERIRRLEDTVDAVAAAAKDVPVLIAASGTRLLRLAAAKAATIALGVPPHFTEEQVAARLDELYELAGDRFHGLELAMNLVSAGGEPPAWLGPLGPDATGLLRGTPAEMADTLRRRRDRLGVSYVSVNAQYLEAFAPVVELLAGT